MATRILAVLAGETPTFQSLGDLKADCDFVYAADSGQEVCLQNGFRPDVVVGDLDSVGERLDGVQYRLRDDQDFSDCDKLLKEISRLGDVDLIVGGLEGDRFDHVLASLGSIVRSGLDPKILFQQGYGQIVRARGELCLEDVEGQVFSVVGLGEAVVSTLGAKWEMDRVGVSFESGASLSNVVEGEVLTITVHEGVVLMVLGSGTVRWK